MAATLKELQELHKTVAKTLTKIIEQNNDDDIPTDAATLGAAIKFLKDNAVTADPSEADDLDDLRKELSEQSRLRKEQREQRRSNVVSLARGDLKEANGG